MEKNKNRSINRLGENPVTTISNVLKQTNINVNIKTISEKIQFLVALRLFQKYINIFLVR